MGEREDLRGLRVGAVDEDRRAQLVRERKPTKLLRVELAVGVAADNAVDHDEYADARQPRCSDDVRPRSKSLRARSGSNASTVAHLTCGLVDAHVGRERPDERQQATHDASAHSLDTNPGAAGIGRRVEQVWARSPDFDFADRAEVGNRETLLGRLGQEQIADRRICRCARTAPAASVWAASPSSQAGSALKRGKRASGSSRERSRARREHLRPDGYANRHGPDRGAAAKAKPTGPKGITTEPFTCR